MGAGRHRHLRRRDPLTADRRGGDEQIDDRRGNEATLHRATAGVGGRGLPFIIRFNKATASGLATGGRIARNVPSANVIGVRPAMSGTSSRAP